MLSVPIFLNYWAICQSFSSISHKNYAYHINEMECNIQIWNLYISLHCNSISKPAYNEIFLVI